MASKRRNHQRAGYFSKLTQRRKSKTDDKLETTFKDKHLDWHQRAEPVFYEIRLQRDMDEDWEEAEKREPDIRLSILVQRNLNQIIITPYKQPDLEDPMLNQRVTIEVPLYTV